MKPQPLYLKTQCVASNITRMEPIAVVWEQRRTHEQLQNEKSRVQILHNKEAFAEECIRKPTPESVAKNSFLQALHVF